MKSPSCSTNGKNFRMGRWGLGCLRGPGMPEGAWKRRSQEDGQGLGQDAPATKGLELIVKAKFNHQKVLSR